MRIDGLPNQSKVSQSNQAQARSKKPVVAASSSDVVELSGGAPDVGEMVNAAKASSVANPRLEGIQKRVESGYYNTPEALEEIAGAVIGSGRVDDVAAEIVQTQSAQAQMANVPDVRADRVEAVVERLNSEGPGFYDTPDMKSATIDGFLDEIA